MSRNLDMTDADRSISQADGCTQKYAPLTDSYSEQVPNHQQQTQMCGNPYQQFHPHFAPCFTCGVYRHIRKNFPQQTFIQQHYSRNTTPVPTPSNLSRQTTPSLMFPQAFIPNSSPRLKQQLHNRLYTESPCLE